MKRKRIVAGSLIASSTLVAMMCLTLPAVAQQAIVYPAKSQTAEQQARDEAECYAWAKQSTGVDPAAMAQASTAVPAQTAPTTGAGGERLRGAARGAAGGAIIGEIADDDAGKGAAVGAVAGAMAGGAKARQKQAAEQEAQQQQQAQQQQVQAQQQQQMADYYRAFAACMEGRGYTVK